MFNTAMEDIEQTFNTATPIAYGGTGATSAIDARDTLGFAARDNISIVGLAGDDPNQPYVRQSSTNNLLLLQRAMTSGTGWNRIGSLLIQRASVVITTDANGIGTILLPQPYTSGTSYVPVAWNGDIGSGGLQVNVNHYRNAEWPGTVGFLIRAQRSDTGANYAGLLRVDYIAIGI